MKISDFDYTLPSELIAQTPIEPRDQSRLMVLDRASGSTSHHRFPEVIDYMQPGDVLVFNDSRVIPARLIGKKLDSGGKLEVLLLRHLSHNVWETLVKPGRRARIGSRIEITGDSSDDDTRETGVTAEVTGLGEGGTRVMSFSDEAQLLGLGKIPLPPYIHMPCF